MNNGIFKTLLLGACIPAFLFVHMTKADDFTGKSGTESHPGLQVESVYAEAVLAYNRQHSDDAMKLLDQVLAEQPNHIESLELKSLMLKSAGKNKEALQIYLKLIQLKPVRETGPYCFEVGAILNKLGETSRAAEYFETSLLLGFNVEASHLFLGIIYYNTGNPKKAEANFKAIEFEGIPEMRVAAHLYLGLIYLKWGYPYTGSQELKLAKEVEATAPDNKTVKDTAAAADGVLGSFRKSIFFTSFSSIFQYDTNISSVPSTSGAEAEATNNATAQIKLSAAVGYMSPSINTIQVVPSYQVSWNYNFNPQTKQFEFFTNSASLYVNYKPLEKITGGVKSSGNFIFNNQPTDSTAPAGASIYTRYSLTGSVGPYVKAQLTPEFQVGWEFDLGPQDYFSSPLSGTDYQTRFSAQLETKSAWLNPGAFLLLDNDSTTNYGYVYRSYGWELSNTFRPTLRDTVTLALDYTYYNYYLSSPLRQDTTWNPHVSVLHSINDKWSILGDLGYTSNGSTIPSTYTYTRFVTGVGLSRSL
jgi:tetratricopeptide (TPR) repeat protein